MQNLLQPFSTIPFLRILLPFIAGILLALQFGLPGIGPLYFAVLLCLLATAIKFSKQAVLILADVFLLLYGISLVQQNDMSRNALFYGNFADPEKEVEWKVVIDELPVEKEKTFKCPVRVLEVKQDSGFVPVKGSMIVYIRRSLPAKLLAPGNTLLIRAKPAELPGPQNPYEFDYKAYLANRQVYHIAFVDSTAFERVETSGQLNAVWQAGLNIKRTIMQRLADSELSNDARSICAALLTGYDDDIDRPVMEAFAHSGTLHVLSVSGLHTGLIYLVLGFLFDLVDRHRRYKLLKFCFITLVLWAFALITGFAAPVLRAVVMFNLLGIGAIYFRNNARNQVNILLVSVFVLLSYNPFFITDVGFLLSYFAMLGLICFQPWLQALWQPKQRAVNYIWQSVAASVAATVSTLPLTLFWFKQFPLWFFVCNLVVVPATFVLLFLALLVVLKLPLVAVISNGLTAGLIRFIGLFNSSGAGFIDNIHFDLPDILFLTVLILVASAVIRFRSYKAAAAGLLVLITWQCAALFDSYMAKRESLLSVYQLKQSSLLSVKNTGSVRFSASDPASYNYHLRPQLIRFDHPDTTAQAFNYVAAGAQSILLLNTPGAWPDADYTGVTTLVLANNFTVTAADLQRFESLRTVVADGSNNRRAIKKAEDLCCKFGLSFYNTKQKGAYLLAL